MNLFRHTIRLALPAVLENLFISMVFLVDALMVASLGAAPLAAAGLAGVVMWRLISTLGCVRIGLGAATARRWGEGRTGEACDLSSHGFVLGLIFGSVILVVYPGAEPLFRLLNAEGDVLREVLPYFRVIVLIVPLRLASINIASSIRAAGNTRAPMVITIIANIVNVTLNYILIYGEFGAPRMELYGAGLATCIAITLEFFCFVALGIFGVKALRVFRPEPIATPATGQELQVYEEHYRARRQLAPVKDRLHFTAAGLVPVLPKFTRTIFRVSYPVALEEILMTIGFWSFFAMIGEFGEIALAAHTAIIRIESFSFLAGFGISIAAATLVGQALGAKSPDNARRSFAHCFSLAFVLMGFIGLMFTLFPDWFLGWFVASDAEDFTAFAVPLMIIVSIEQPFIGAGNVLANGLRGAGETTSPLIAQLFGVIGARVGGGYLLAFPAGLGMEGLYWATVMDWTLRTAILGVVVLRGKWQNIEV